jgi:pimeloyl-ACP methyl ester carboxylesterase
MLSAFKDISDMEQTTYIQIFGSAARDVRLKSDIILCGHSFGGLTALITAAKLGQQCKAVCVMDPFLHAFETEC